MSEKDLTERVQPFSDCAEYVRWMLNNCYQCKWGSDNNNCVRLCAIEFSLDRAQYTNSLVSQWIIYVAGIGSDGKCKVREQR